MDLLSLLGTLKTQPSTTPNRPHFPSLLYNGSNLQIIQSIYKSFYILNRHLDSKVII